MAPSRTQRCQNGGQSIVADGPLIPIDIAPLPLESGGGGIGVELVMGRLAHLSTGLGPGQVVCNRKSPAMQV